ncbi:MAG: thiol peroxidase, partial [Thermodesulfobacteriota bacterium]
TIKFKGDNIQTNGNFPKKGAKAPEFSLVGSDLSTISLSKLAGKKVVLNIFPSVDTSVCATQLRTFSQKLSGRDDVALVFASMDLPFAFNRFCAAENISNAITASDFRDHSLAKNYGVKMVEGPVAGLYARAVLVLDENHTIRHAELVNEVTEEPNYDEAIAAL